MAVRDLCRSRHHGRDARQNSSRSRYHIEELFGRDAAMAGACRRAVRPHSVVDHRAGDELEHRAQFDAVARAFCRHQQPRLFHRQTGASALGAPGLDRGRDRAVSAGPNAAPTMTAMIPWLGLGLLILAGLGVVFTGIPAAVVLLATACFGAAIASLSGDAPV